MKLACLLMTPVLLSTGLSLRPVRWSLVGGNAPRQAVAGRAVPVTLQADIAKGWYIYALTQPPGGPIPLRIALAGAGDLSVRGVIQAPQPKKYFDKNFGITTEMYSGSPRFTVPVGVPGRTASGLRRLDIAARYQVCSDRLCLPPRTDTVRVSLRIARR